MNFQQALEKHYSEVYSLYRDIVNISSQSYDKEGIDKVGDTIAQFMTEHNFSVKKQLNEKAGNGVVASMNDENDGQKIVFLAHMDTVHKKGTFEEPLFKEEGDDLYGPGVLDCKGGIAMGILMMMALREIGYDAPVKYIFAPDEEISLSLSGQKGIDFINKNVEGASAVFTLESGTKDRIVTGRKGAMRYEVIVKGKASHAGSAYGEGISAIKEACTKILEIEKNSDTNGITYNCGIINGGKIPNSVPDLCTFVLDIRYRNQVEEDAANELVKKVIDTSYFAGTTSEMRLLSRRPAMEETKENLALFEKVKEVSARLGFEKFESFLSGGASDAAFPTIMGIPTLCGMGIVGHSQHTLRETAKASSLIERGLVIGTVILEMKEGK